MSIYNDEQMFHTGVKGMKWGHRTTYGKAPTMITSKRQLAADKKTLDKMNNGNHHTSVGLTKKRQEAYDKRDKAILEKRIEKNTKKQTAKKDGPSKLAKGLDLTIKILATAGAVGAHHANKAANEELKVQGKKITGSMLNAANDAKYKKRINDIWA